jgi:hypothetical protein
VRGWLFVSGPDLHYIMCLAGAGFDHALIASYAGAQSPFPGAVILVPGVAASQPTSVL